MGLRLKNALIMSCILLSTAGCVGKSAPTRFYMLDAGDIPLTVPSIQARPVVVLEEVTIPPYLDRPNIVTRTRTARVHLADFDYWAEPLRDAVSRYMLIALSHISSATVVAERSAENDFNLKISILRFDSTEDGNVTLHAMWSLERYNSDVECNDMNWKHASYSEKSHEASYADIVRTQSKMLVFLAEDIAKSIK